MNPLAERMEDRRLKWPECLDSLSAKKYAMFKACCPYHSETWAKLEKRCQKCKCCKRKQTTVRFFFYHVYVTCSVNEKHVAIRIQME